jgi:hypothetical protein
MESLLNKWPNSHNQRFEVYGKTNSVFVIHVNAYQFMSSPGEPCYKRHIAPTHFQIHSNTKKNFSVIIIDLQSTILCILQRKQRSAIRILQVHRVDTFELNADISNCDGMD